MSERSPRAEPAPPRWTEVRALAEAVLAQPPERRAALLDRACGGDAPLRAEVEAQVRACERAAQAVGFLAEPAAAFAAPLLAAAPDDVAVVLRATLGARYDVERELGRGGMATVYLARDVRHQRRVALKVLHPELGAALGAERFLREIELTAGLQHPHILPLFDSGRAGGLLYYVMPYVDGETLRTRLTRERQLPLDDALGIAREVADALAYAHARGVVHRDVKPENVLLHDGHALVADFGIALAVREAGGGRMTRTGLSLGTPQYMAPEQASGGRGVDARADVYALGAVTYEMLVGEPPFTGPTAEAVVARMMTETPRGISGQRPSVPLDVEAAVLRAIERLPGDRFVSARAFGDALRAGGRAGGGAGGVWTVPSRMRRGPVLVALAVAAGLASAAGGAAWPSSSRGRA